jgi:hypothetical protein
MGNRKIRVEEQPVSNGDAEGRAIDELYSRAPGFK